MPGFSIPNVPLTIRTNKARLQRTQYPAHRMQWHHPLAMAADGGGYRSPIEPSRPAAVELTSPTRPAPQPPKLPGSGLLNTVGTFLNGVPAIASVPTLFVTEFCLAMPLVNLAWEEGLGLAYDFEAEKFGFIVREPHEVGGALALGALLAFTLFGTRALISGKEYAAREEAQANARQGADLAGASLPEAPARTAAQRIVDGGLLYGLFPLFSERLTKTLRDLIDRPRIIKPLIPPIQLATLASFSTDMVKSAVLYGATGALLGLDLDTYLPAAIGLAAFSNWGGSYLGRVWGSLDRRLGDMLAVCTGIFFTAHAISGMENVIDRINTAYGTEVLPDGMGYAAQASIATLISLLIIWGVRDDAKLLDERVEAKALADTRANTAA
jgi:hypothetical protein